MPNVFEKLAAREHENDTKLGMPATDQAHHDRRLHLMSMLRGGKGFGTPAKQPRKDAQGLTRGDRKRLRRAAANAKVSEERDLLFMHRAARRRLLDEMIVAEQNRDAA